MGKFEEMRPRRRPGYANEKRMQTLMRRIRSMWDYDEVRKILKEEADFSDEQIERALRALRAERGEP
jgi:hypothetical protein